VGCELGHALGGQRSGLDLPGVAPVAAQRPGGAAALLAVPDELVNGEPERGIRPSELATGDLGLELGQFGLASRMPTSGRDATKVRDSCLPVALLNTRSW